MTNLRLAETADLPHCRALPATVQSQHIWQVNVVRDATQPLAAGDFTVTLRAARLPRAISVDQPGLGVEVAWQSALAVIIAEEADEIQGFVIVSAVLTRLAVDIPYLVVAPSRRQEGIGTRLLREAMRWARGFGYSTAQAACTSRNYPAVACLSRTGFSFGGYSETLYARNEIALLWQRPI